MYIFSAPSIDSTPTLLTAEIHTTTVLPIVHIKEPKLEFGQALCGNKVIKSVSIVNRSDDTVPVQLQTIGRPEFTFLSNCTELAPQETKLLLFSFTPILPQLLTYTVVVETPTAQLEIELQGQGIRNELTVKEGNQFDVGDCMVGMALTKQFHLVNNTTFNFPFSLTTTPTLNHNFITTPVMYPTPQTGIIHSGEESAVTVSFQPDHADVFAATIYVSEREKITVTGRGHTRQLYLVGGEVLTHTQHTTLTPSLHYSNPISFLDSFSTDDMLNLLGDDRDQHTKKKKKGKETKRESSSNNSNDKKEQPTTEKEKKSSSTSKKKKFDPTVLDPNTTSAQHVLLTFTSSSLDPTNLTSWQQSLTVGSCLIGDPNSKDFGVYEVQFSTSNSTIAAECFKLRTLPSGQLKNGQRDVITFTFDALKYRQSLTSFSADEHICQCEVKVILKGGITPSNSSPVQVIDVTLKATLDH